MTHPVDPQKAVFILNPKSGVQSSISVPDLIQTHLNHARWAHEIIFTEYAGHATQLAQAAAAEGARLVVAVGGDGTVNEVARGLLKTTSALGILPKGSGNGLARHLGIPMDITRALEIVNTVSFGRIDSCTINEHPFFTTSGIGFDGLISSIFAKSSKRGLGSYISLIIQEFRRFKAQQATLHVNGRELTTDFFVMAFGNAAQYGNNAFIAPMADIQDGFLDVCLIRKVGLKEAIQLGYSLMTKQLAHSSLAEFHTCSKVHIESKKPQHFHADGEYRGQARKFDIQLYPQSLEVLAPLMTKIETA